MKKTVLLLLFFMVPAYGMQQNRISFFNKLKTIFFFGFLMGNAADGPEPFVPHDLVVHRHKERFMLDDEPFTLRYDWQGQLDCQEQMQYDAHSIIKNRLESERCSELCIGFFDGKNHKSPACSVCGRLYPVENGDVEEINWGYAYLQRMPECSVSD